ncbi:hypothetical protein D3P08_16775 [Paenibacillus nanensis]|uniref:Uncharacterized protein n=1 Tax=Paenibacillus nanensis TaxID=393251 RepID=A0A3A1USU5_9BACL|nr:glycoside hydrolase family 44 protein [Paenibacillus nanensis]RIX51557.1 hypothetical protein D3P08_16775 [Paenibacillus nanensis]
MKTHLQHFRKNTFLLCMAALLLFNTLSFGRADGSALSGVTFQASAAPAASRVEAGTSVTVHVKVTASAQADVLVDVEFFDSQLNNVGKTLVDNIRLEAGVEKIVPLTWNVPASLPPGEYLISFGLFGAGWKGSDSKWFPGAAKITVTPGTQQIGVPGSLKAVPASDSITVSWSPATLATGYEVEIDGGAITEVSGTLYKHEGLKPGTAHSYRVRGKNAAEVGSWSAVVTASVSAPSSSPTPTPTPTSTTSPTPTPTATPSETPEGSFKVLTETGNNAKTSSITPKFKITNQSKSDISLKDIKIRYYFTADFAKDEEKAFAIGFYSLVKWRSLSASDVTTAFVKMPVPAAQADHYLEVGFKEQAGVIKPTEVLTFSGWMNKSDWSSFDQTNDYSYPNSSSEAESVKTVVYQAGEPVWGAEPELLDLPSFPDPVRRGATDTSITLEWDEVPDATGYEVYADGVITTVTTASFVYDFLKPGTLHTFKIRTLKGDAASLWSSAFTVKTTGEQQLPVPLGIRAAKTDSSITLTWKALKESVTGYDVEVDGIVVPVGMDLSYTHAGLEPASLHAYRIRAKDGATLGPWSDAIKVNTLRVPEGTFNVEFQVDPTADRAPISPYIYGANEDLTGTENLTSRRAGGNRFSAYNWENNASNSGGDEGHVSDSFVPWYYGGIPVSEKAKWEIPGSAAVGFHQKSLEQGAYTLWTLPMAGYAAKDKNGRVTKEETAPSNRWVEVKAAKGAPFSLTPDLNDNAVYNDELVNLMVNKFGPALSATGIKGYSMDNEPGLWDDTHPYMHPDMPRGAEVLQKSLELSKAVKNVDPGAEMFGPVSYGFSDAYMVDNKAEWNEIKGNYRWYLDYYLDNMARESRKEGKRLLDVLDIHWYSEEMGGGTRITNTTLENHTLETHKVRVQAPRSLWDPSYLEDTWIGTWYSEFLPLIPTMQNSIDTYNPGTKLAITEYDFGGGHHVSGGIAQADTLGIFGEQGMYMAHYWNMAGTARLSQIPYLSSGFRIFNNYDGSRSKYGDTSVLADTNDIENSSIYSSVFKEDNGELHMIVINKNFDHAMNAQFTIGGDTAYKTAKVWAFDEQSPQITEREGLADIQGNRFTLSIPKLTVAHIVLSENEQ